MKHFWTVCITPQPCHSHFCCCLLPIWPKLHVWPENWAYGLCRLGWRYNRANLYFSWPYMIVSMIWNTSKLSASHLRRATAIFVVDCCQFSPCWMFGLKMELIVCDDLVGGTTDQSCIFPDLIWYYKWYETLLNCLHHTSAMTQSFLLLVAANFDQLDVWAENGAYGVCRLGWRYNRTKLYFFWPYMILSMIWNSF